MGARIVFFYVGKSIFFSKFITQLLDMITSNSFILQMKQMMNKLQTFIEDSNLEGLATAMSELESLEDLQEEYMVQLENEQMLLINKIKELGQEFLNSSPSLSRRSSGY